MEVTVRNGEVTRIDALTQSIDLVGTVERIIQESSGYTLELTLSDGEEVSYTVSSGISVTQNGTSVGLSALRPGYRLGLAVTHVPEGAVWMTLTGHLNTVAAATLNRAAAVVLCGGQHWPGEAVAAAREHGVNLFQSPLPSFEAACPPVLRAAEKTAGERETAR